MEYALTEWEDNGYHDSYFYAAVWDTELRTVRAIQTGATAYAGGIRQFPPIQDHAMLAEALAWLAEHIFNVIRGAEHRDVLEPKAVAPRDELRLTRNVRHKGETLAAGLQGRVFWSGAYGQFYRNGYNKPGRENTRVGLELTDGRRVFVALGACRHDREPMTDGELRQRALALSENCGFSFACGCKAWESANYALALYKNTSVAEQCAA